MTYKSKGKLPYIPLYIGDWEQDTNCISLEAEGALLKLVFKLWKSEEKGTITMGLTQVAILLKKNEEIALKIIKELDENGVLNIQFLPESRIKITSRRIAREVGLSSIRSESGSQGGRPKTEEENQNESKLKAKLKLIAEYDNDIEYVIDYLNKKTNSKFRKETASTQKFIIARLSEKYTRSDFEAVIDHKFQEWGLDPKMVAYLRPETLFGTKFESYLQASKIKINTSISTNQNGKPSNQVRQSVADERRASVDAMENIADAILRGAEAQHSNGCDQEPDPPDNPHRLAG